MRVMPDDQIMELEWPPPNTEKHPSKQMFVFVSVDVIGHSKLFRDGMDDLDLLERHDLLLNLRTFVRECFDKNWSDDNGLEWDWAGDGGIYAIPTRFATLWPVDHTFLTAVKIANDLEEFNKNKNPLDPIQLRIVLDYGEGYHYHERELRRGAALNFVAKLRVPGRCTSITVTRELMAHLKCRMPHDFRRIDVSEQTNRDVYAYLPTLQTALIFEVEATRQNDPMQAAHLAYRLGVLYFGTDQQERAINVFNLAISLLGEVKHPHRYYLRTMKEFYSLWRRLAIDIPREELEKGDGNDRRQMLRNLEHAGFFNRYDKPEAWALLHEMEFCLEQLDILAHRPVSDPIGLTSLQICLMLERVGYPRQWHGSAISERIKRIEAELEESRMWAHLEEEHETIDMACGLCSGVAASCLALDDNSRAGDLIEWLASKKKFNYAYRSAKIVSSRASSDQHAMHYTAAVLQAFVDHDLNRNVKLIDDVLDKYFDGATVDERAFPRKWVKFRNISIPEYCLHVFAVFARTIMARGSLGDTNTAPARLHLVRDTLKKMARLLLAEAVLGGLRKTPGRLYAARDNFGSFALAILVGMPDQSIRIFEGLRKGMSAVSADILPDQQRRRTSDSNIDRVRKWLDGWLLQWECALYVRDTGGSFTPNMIERHFSTRPALK